MARDYAERWLRRLLGFLIVFVIALAWWLRHEPAVQSAVAALSQPLVLSPEAAEFGPGVHPDEARVRWAETSPQGRITLAETSELLQRLHAPDGGAEEDLEILQSLLALYRRTTEGANPPGGLNEEIVDGLCGRNTRRLALLPPDWRDINLGGQLIDRWGTPYFFHPVSRTHMEIRSAGPDRKWWTKDDVSGTGEGELAVNERGARGAPARADE